MRIAVGRGAGHEPPITPLALLSAIAVELIVPATVALPVQTVPSPAIPLNDNWPSSDDPLKVAVTLPVHEIWSPVHVAAIDEPCCVTSMVICSEALFDDANVPRHAPEISATLPPVADVGLFGEPEQAHATTASATRS